MEVQQVIHARVALHYCILFYFSLPFLESASIGCVARTQGGIVVDVRRVVSLTNAFEKGLTNLAGISNIF